MPQILLALQEAAGVNAVAIQSQIGLRLDAPGTEVAAGAGVDCQVMQLAMSGPIQASVSAGVGISVVALGLGMAMPQHSASISHGVAVGAHALSLSLKSASVSAGTAVNVAAYSLAPTLMPVGVSSSASVAAQSTPALALSVHGGSAYYVHNETVTQQSPLRLSMAINQTEVEREILSTYFADSEIETGAMLDAAMAVSSIIVSRIDNEAFAGKSPIDVTDSGESEITTSILLTSEVE